jgi:glycosyltransferase involved in cell wall biosynthesis
VIEGLASHCVVVCSDAGSLPEVAGEFGHVFKCGDAAEMARALMRVLLDLRPFTGPPVYRVGLHQMNAEEYYAAADTYVQPFLPEAAVKAFYDIVKQQASQRFDALAYRAARY